MAYHLDDFRRVGTERREDVFATGERLDIVYVAKVSDVGNCMLTLRGS